MPKPITIPAVNLAQVAAVQLEQPVRRIPLASSCASCVRIVSIWLAAASASADRAARRGHRHVGPDHILRSPRRDTLVHISIPNQVHEAVHARLQILRIGQRARSTEMGQHFHAVGMRFVSGSIDGRLQLRTSPLRSSTQIFRSGRPVHAAP